MTEHNHNHDHDHDHDHEVENEVVTLVDDEGNEHQFEVITVIEVAEKEYAVLFPLDGEDEEGSEEAVILRIEKDENDEDVLVDIEDDEEWERVVAAWEDILSEEGDEDENE